MTSPAYEDYRRHERHLIHVRWVNRGAASPQEDEVLDAMEEAWTRLTEDERRVVDAEPPRSLIREPPAPRRALTDRDILDAPRTPVRALGEVA